MRARSFEEYPSSQPSPTLLSDSPAGQPYDAESKERAVAQLLRHEVVSHTFGKHEEYEVRTTMTTRQAWQYRCCVLREGRLIKRAFSPIVIDHTQHMQHVQRQPGVAKAMRLSFAREAVDVHFTRCATLQEYLLLATIYSQPPPRSRPRYAFLGLLIGAMFLAVYGVWRTAPWTDGKQPSGNPPSRVQGAQHAVVDRRPTQPPSRVSLPTFNGAASSAILDEQVGSPPVTRPAERPKPVRLSDLLASEKTPERADQSRRPPTLRLPPGSTASDVQAGDLLLLTGWIHRVSRAPDHAYRLQLSPSPRAAAPSLIAVVPSPDQASESPAVQAQLQTVRAFITRRLLREREPSPQGSVIRQPLFVQLSGQLLSPDAPLGEPAQGDRRLDATARWEVRPVLEIEVATPPVPTKRSRRK